MISTKKIRDLLAFPVGKLINLEEEKRQKEKDRHQSSNNNFRLKKFRNGDMAIAYKENFVDGKARPSDLIYKIMQKRKQDSRQSKKHRILEGNQAQEAENYQGLLLEKSFDERWFIKNNVSNQLSEPEPDISYIFVTMPSGTIRISTRNQDGHISLSGFSQYVKYAGEVIFSKNQKIISWNNASYSYSPPPFLAFQSNFQEGTRFFSKKVDRNDPQLEAAPIFSKKC
ncbi:MAG: hypothetical protein K0R24_1559 [Gammaproteobacteria bacterium]|jgi:hypothetical protein|nr:hypothetical protein [Gammaproteobacteria bacterium]